MDCLLLFQKQDITLSGKQVGRFCGGILRLPGLLPLAPCLPEFKLEYL